MYHMVGSASPGVVAPVDGGWDLLVQQAVCE